MRFYVTSTMILAVSGFLCGQTYTIQTIAGGVLPNNIAGTSASLGSIPSVAVDKSGNVYFSAPDYGVVLRLDASTQILSIVAGTGIQGYSGDNGPAASAELGYVTSVAVDAAGNLFILDQARVREVSGGTITTVAGNGAFGFAGDGGPATSAEWRQAQGIAVDSAGNLYIADSGNNRIRRVTNGIISTVAGNGRAGYAGDGGLAVNAELKDPAGVAADASGNLYIADLGNARVRKVFDGVITTIAGNGTPAFGGDGGPATIAALLPTALAVDAMGDLYIADALDRIREVSNGVIHTVAGNGTPGFTGDGDAATSAELDQPDGVAVDSAGNLFIADSVNGRVRRVAKGIIATVAGGGGVGDYGPATKAQLVLPMGVALDRSGNLYIADSGSDRLRKVSNGVITTVAGNGIPGSSGDKGPALNAELSEPTAVAVDPAGNLYVTSTSSVRKISSGIITTIAGPGGLTNNLELIAPYGLALDAAGDLFIANTYADCILEISNQPASTVAGSQFNPGYGGDSGPANRAQLNAPYGVALDSAGNLYVADTNNNVIRKISNGIITTVAGNGTAGYSGDGGPATSAQLLNPIGVALDSSGSLYITDNYNDRVRKVSGGVITTIAGSGAHGFSGDNGPATAAALDAPFGIAVDPAGSVYFANAGSQRISLLVPSAISTCTYALNPAAALTIPKEGGSITAEVQTAGGCTWAPDGLPGWLAVSGSAVSTGPGSVSLNASANPGNERTVYVSIAGIQVQVTQQGLLSINAGGVVNAASYTAPVAPGSIAAVFGDFPLTAPVTNNTLPLATELPLPGGTWDFYLPFPAGDAPLFYASAGQANIQVPWELAGQTQTTLAFFTQPTNTGGIPQTVALAPFAPGIFSTNAQGTGQGAIQDANYRLVDTSNPASGGDIVLIYCTGLGEVTNVPPTGSPASDNPLSRMPVPPVVTIGGVPAEVKFAGLAPGYVGLYQVNAQVPPGLPAGNATPVVISMGDVMSNTVTMAIQ